MIHPSETFKQHPFYVISYFLVIVGAFNWLVFGLMHKDFVLPLVGPNYANYVYILVGIAGMILLQYNIYFYFKQKQQQ